jgi:NADH:ubiquinone oxidoreductase subunit 6 (subunit J)
MTKHHFFIIVLCLGLLFIIGNSVLAYSWTDVGGFYGQTAGKMGLNVNLKDPAQIVAAIINSLLLLVGAVFVIMVIYSGFTWMTSAGNEEKIKKSKQNLIYAVIGVIIISSAYSISLFISTTIEQSSPVAPGGSASPGAKTCTDRGGVCKSSYACQQASGTNLGTTNDCTPDICCLISGGGATGNCNDCGQGSTNICDANECGSLGTNCVFYNGVCYTRGDCSRCGYGKLNPCDAAECLAIGGCTWDSSTNTCER